MLTGTGQSGRSIVGTVAGLCATIALAGSGDNPMENKTNLLSVRLQLSKAVPPKPGCLSIKLINDSTHPIRVWQRSNSWGYDSVTLTVRIRNRDEGLRYRIRSLPLDFTRNGPGFYEIKSGESVTLNIDLDDGFWEIPAQLLDHRHEELDVRAELVSGPSPEADKHGVFVGSAESGWVRSTPPHSWLR